MNIKKAILNDLTQIKKYLLLLLSDSPNIPIKGDLWYQKELFMLSKNESELAEEADFEPYFWGPYSELAKSEMEELIQLGIVKKIGTKYQLTELGKEISNEVANQATKIQKELVHDIKDFLNDLSREELLLFIYMTYPNMCEDIVEFKSALKRRRAIAMSLYRRTKISLEKAAELAGVSVSEFIKLGYGFKKAD